jgi:hypothetical protein
MRKAKSIPVETPAEVNTGSQSKKDVYPYFGLRCCLSQEIKTSPMGSRFTSI